MNDKEIFILQLIKENPFVTQNEIAEKMGLSRSAVAGYISSLTKEGKLLGRAYVLPKRKKLFVLEEPMLIVKFKQRRPFSTEPLIQHLQVSHLAGSQEILQRI
ncbi:winged helix-turn-helix transcriptional regulator [Niallia circulans]